MKRKATVAAVIWCASGCGVAADRVDGGSGDGSAGANSQADTILDESSLVNDERRICDGSPGIRLAMGYGGGGQPFPYTSVLSELGYDFLYVDGSCHYWAHQPLSVADEYYLWRPYREGVLTPADEQRLHDAVSDGHLQADSCAPRRAVPDAGAAFLWHGSGLRSCADDIFDATGPLRAELYDAATAVTGPIRLQIGNDSYSASPVLYDWPLATPIDQFVIEYGETRSFRIDDVAAATALRSLRERAIEDSEASSRPFPGVISIRSSEANEIYFMSLRDELPFVGPDGTWEPTP